MSTWISLFILILPMLIWVVGIVLSLVNRWRNHKKYLLILIACSWFLLTHIALLLGLDYSISRVPTAIGWGILYYAIFNPGINAADKENPPETEKPPYLKSVAIGLGTGVIGAIIGFFPILFLHWYLGNSLRGVYGSWNTIPKFLLYLVAGYTMPFGGVIFVPIGGAVFGCIGSLIGLKRHSPRLWLWGGIAGFLFNFFVSFTAQ